MKGILFFLLTPLLFLSSYSHSQVVDHWEGLVLRQNVWSYRYGLSEPPTTWNQTTFDDKNWLKGQGGIGYGDGDDATVINPSLSLYMRKTFSVSDTDRIVSLRLYADYDDGFVAYLNGIEIQRSNLPVGSSVAHNQAAMEYREAQMYQGLYPEVFVVDRKLLRQGNNVLAVQVHNHSSGSSDMSAIFYLLAGVSDSTVKNQSLPVWFKEPFESSNLPLIKITTNGKTIPDEPKITGYMEVIDNGSGKRNYPNDSANAYDGWIGIELRGASSLSFPKKNYTIETRLENGENNNVSLLGLPEENDWVLHGPYSDKSLLRNVLAYHIAHQMGRYAPRTRWCEVLIDGEYRGLYVLTEKIKQDKNRVNIKKLDANDNSGENLTGGYIFSADRDRRGPLSGWYSKHPGNLFYRFRDPNYTDVTDAQRNYLIQHMNRFEDMMANPESAQFYYQFIDVDSWVDYWLATEIYKHIDNYKFSFYMYKERARKGGKLYFGPVWDINLGFGNFDFVRDPGPEGWSYIWGNNFNLRPMWVQTLSERKEIQNRFDCRWSELRSKGLHTDSLIAFINQQIDITEEARKRNFERWSILGKYIWPNNYVGQTYNEEVQYLRTWLINRLKWMDNNMLGNCELLGREELNTSEELELVFPNPFHDELFLDMNSSAAGGINIRMIDATGSIVLNKKLSRGLNRLDVSNIPNGIYFYEINSRAGLLKSGKLIKTP